MLRRPAPSIVVVVVIVAPLLLLARGGAPARAVDAFEIQVYDGTADPPGVPGIEAHINGVPDGRTTATPPELPPDGQFHLTFEPSLGMTPIWEIGGYLQTALLPDGDFRFAGVKLRSKLIVPSGLLPPNLRLGCNFEVSYLPVAFERERWGGEIRPIIAWEDARWSFAVNPIVDLSFTGGAPDLEPAAMALIKVRQVVSVGFEYYAALGPLTSPSPFGAQQHTLFEVVNLLAVRDFELNVGVGEGLTAASNAVTLKAIVGYAFEGRVGRGRW
jgi:hypothetical protein